MAPQELATVPRGKALPYVYVAWPSVGVPGTFVPPWALCVGLKMFSVPFSQPGRRPRDSLSTTITQHVRALSPQLPATLAWCCELCRALVTGIAELRGIAWWIG